MRTYIIINNGGASVDGWPTNTVRYYLFPAGGTCQQDEAAFMALLTPIQADVSLTRAQKLAQVIAITTANAPAAQAGYYWKVRECGAVEEVYAIADNIDRSNGTYIPGNDPGAADPAAETDTEISTSQTGDDGGPKNQ